MSGTKCHSVAQTFFPPFDLISRPPKVLVMRKYYIVVKAEIETLQTLTAAKNSFFNAYVICPSALTPF